MNNEPIYGTYIGGDDQEEAGTARFRTAKIQTYGDGVQSVPFMHTPQGIRSAYGESPAVVMNPRGRGYEMLKDNRQAKIQKHRGYHNGRPDDPHGVTASYNRWSGGSDNDWGPPSGSRVPVRPRGPVGSSGAAVSMKG